MVQRSEIAAAVNGQMMGTTVGENITNSPTFFDMAIGKSEDWNSVEWQFEGSVKYIQEFTNSTENKLYKLYKLY